LVAVNRPGLMADYPTLGLDKHGVYIGIAYGNSATGEVTQAVAAIPKRPLIDGTASQVQPENSANVFDVPYFGGAKVVQPVISFDPSPVDNIAWMLLKGAPYAKRSGEYLPGKILYGRLRWNPAAAVF